MGRWFLGMGVGLWRGWGIWRGMRREFRGGETAVAFDLKPLNLKLILQLQLQLQLQSQLNPNGHH
ncbi:hypothetical protein CS8_043260 [Cupriavidus sp. 8B]